MLGNYHHMPAIPPHTAQLMFVYLLPGECCTLGVSVRLGFEGFMPKLNELGIGNAVCLLADNTFSVDLCFF